MRLPTRSVRESSIVGVRIPATREAPRRDGVQRRIGVEEIRRKQSDALLVVARVQHVPDRLERPERWLAGAYIVEHEHFRLQHRLEDTHFRGLAFGVVAVLNFLQKLAVVVEKPAVSAQTISLSAATARCVFPTPQGPISSRPCSLPTGKFLGEALRRRASPARGCDSMLELFARHIFDVVVRLEILEIAVTIAFGDARARQRTVGAVARGAIARNRPHHFRFADR